MAIARSMVNVAIAVAEKAPEKDAFALSDIELSNLP
jgi:hypothetical protein